ncbi:UbiD family decarboxylase [Xylariaceae sp. FL0255]|nr:UbiD family decarboxylase [Xylariaceae sp. FL0255]
MSLNVLSDETIRSLLESLSRDEIEGFTHALKCALHEYSMDTQQIESNFYNQPERTSTYSEATGATTLFMPSVSPVGHGVKVVTVSSPNAPSRLPTIKPTGSLTLYSPEGSPVGFLHAQTLTAFRTALASACLLTKRAHVKTLTVFGSGLQAYWHVRVALMLRGSTIRHVYFINRGFSNNVKDIIRKIHSVPTAKKASEGWGKAEFSVLTPSYNEYARLQKEHIRAADVIYCCTPSTEDLFDASILTSHEGRRKGRLVIAVGSYTPEMRELPKELLLQAVKPHGGHLHYHKHATEGGVVVVDTLDGALKEAGEIIDAGLKSKQLVELGELVMIHRLAREEEESSQSEVSSTISDSLRNSLDLSPPASAMSTVFGSSSNLSPTNDSASSKRSSSQSPSRARRGSTSSSTTKEKRLSGSLFHLPSIGKSHHKRESSSGSNHQKESHNDHMARWLTSGNVIYKSVGFGLMDLTVGLEIVKLAKERGIGAHIENFSA